jgi:predicted enzyme related to lactoylglutathione lyase
MFNVDEKQGVKMDNKIQYVHTNIIAENWLKLADFYIDVFNCRLILPERDLSGEWIDKITGIKNVNIRGAHLELPGCNGITLEIFEYSPEDTGEENNRINSKGFGHIAFHVENVQEILEKAQEHGCRQLGEVVIKKYEDIGNLTVVYITDPEGNFIEIQNWDKSIKK